MEAKELRIGNYVYCIDEHANYKEVQKIDWFPLTMLKYYHPIELNEEWLFNLGAKQEKPPFDGIFVLNGNIPVAQFIDYKKSTIKNKIYYYTFTSHNGAGSINIKITSVHQLQNLYYALTGQELTLK